MVMLVYSLSLQKKFIMHKALNVGKKTMSIPFTFEHACLDFSGMEMISFFTEKIAA
jgi:hypothetical protein